MMERLKRSSVLRVVLAVMVTNCLTYIFCLCYSSSDAFHQSKFYMTYIYSDTLYVAGQGVYAIIVNGSFSCEQQIGLDV